MGHTPLGKVSSRADRFHLWELPFHPSRAVLVQCGPTSAAQGPVPAANSVRMRTRFPAEIASTDVLGRFRETGEHCLTDAGEVLRPAETLLDEPALALTDCVARWANGVPIYRRLWWTVPLPGGGDVAVLAGRLRSM